jgi:renalase
MTDTTQSADVIIIGAGMAGLSCARGLADAGLATLVLDKGRGIGGRMATRRAPALQFDHGAQVITARSDGFAQVLADLTARGAAAPWQDATVGYPTMTAIPKAIGAGLTIRQEAQVTALTPQPRGWQVHIRAEVLRAAHLVIAIPAPQIAALLGGDHALIGPLAMVRYAPSLTLMAGVQAPAPFDCAQDEAADLAWIARDSAKPGRPQGDVTAWVAQASAAFSTQHLEQDKDAVAALMVPLLLDRLGASPDQLRHAVAHRWRHALVTQPLGQPFVADAKARLYLGGDWCLGPRVEDAWTSGTQVARAILTRN